MKLTLSLEEKENFKKKHKKEHDKRVADRIKTIILVSEEWAINDIAKALLISVDTVSRHVSEYLEEQKLKPASGGSKSKLNATQTNELLIHLEKMTYTSTEEIIAYVSKKYNITYSKGGMYDWLVAHNFTYKKTKGVPAKADFSKQEAFIKIYKKLKNSLSEDEVIVFMDSVHPSQATKLSYGWVPKGKEKFIPTVAGQKRLNITGAINLDDKKLFVKEYNRINGEVTAEFLRDLEKTYPKATKIHVIADGARSHCSKSVNLFLGKRHEVNRNYLQKYHNITLPSNTVILSSKLRTILQSFLVKEENIFINKAILENQELTTLSFLDAFVAPPERLPPKIVMHILPPYSPNLNPIERIWKIMNEQVRNNKVFHTFQEFRERIMHFFNHIWNDIKDGIGTRINDNFQVLKSVN